MGYLIKILPLDLAELSDRKSPPPFVQGQHHSQPVRQHNHQTHDPEWVKGLHTKLSYNDSMGLCMKLMHKARYQVSSRA